MLKKIKLPVLYVIFAVNSILILIFNTYLALKVDNALIEIGSCFIYALSVSFIGYTISRMEWYKKRYFETVKKKNKDIDFLINLIKRQRSQNNVLIDGMDAMYSMVTDEYLEEDDSYKKALRKCIIDFIIIAKKDRMKTNIEILKRIEEV